MKVSFLRRLVKEDFSQKDKDLIGKIAYILNPAMEQLSLALHNNLTWADNMAAQVVTINVMTDITGTPINPVSFTSSLPNPIKHIMVTRAVVSDSSSVYVTGAPFINWVQNGTTVNIQNVTGLPANTTFSLTAIASI